MLKKNKNIAKLIIKYKEATPAPPIGAVLGSKGINIMSFCKEFNLKSNKDNFFKKGTPVTVYVNIYINKKFSFIIKTPPTSFLLKNILNIKKGSSQTNIKIVGEINNAQINEIAKIKIPDLNSCNLEKAKKIIIGTAKSMGIHIK